MVSEPAERVLHVDLVRLGFHLGWDHDDFARLPSPHRDQSLGFVSPAAVP